jgi:hypothetical protein
MVGTNIVAALTIVHGLDMRSWVFFPPLPFLHRIAHVKKPKKKHMSCAVVFKDDKGVTHRCSLMVADGQHLCSLHQQACDVGVPVEESPAGTNIASEEAMWKEVTAMLEKITTKNRNTPTGVTLVLPVLSQESEDWIIEYMKETYGKVSWNAVLPSGRTVSDDKDSKTAITVETDEMMVYVMEDSKKRHDLVYQVPNAFTSRLIS